MIVEHEVIEQIEEDALGRPLPWVCELIRSLGRNQPLEVLEGMWRAGHLEFLSADGRALARWECEELFRQDASPDAVRVAATEAGSAWVHGS